MVNNPKDIQKTLKEMKGIKKEELDQALKELDRAFEELKTKEKIIERRDYRNEIKNGFSNANNIGKCICCYICINYIYRFCSSIFNRHIYSNNIKCNI